MILDGKRILVTGVLDPRSIGFHVARAAQEAGAEIVLTSFGRAKRITEVTARRLPQPVDVLELDVTDADHRAAVAAELDTRWGGLDGLVHAVAFAPASCLGGGFLDAPWEDIATAVQVSTYSFAALAGACAPLFRAAGGGSIVGLDFDASVAWPGYDWMGVAKAGLESCCRYVARDLGPDNVRANLVAAGPLHTVAARSIEGFSDFPEMWANRAPLGWDPHDPTPVANAVTMLLSDHAAGVTGNILHVDGGAHATGALAPVPAPAVPVAVPA